MSTRNIITHPPLNPKEHRWSQWPPLVINFPCVLLDSPHLEQPEVFLLLQTVINILLPPRIISTSRSKNFMMESSPAHCSTPGDTGKDLRREGLAESTSQAAYLGENRGIRRAISPSICC